MGVNNRVYVLPLAINSRVEEHFLWRLNFSFNRSSPLVHFNKVLCRHSVEAFVQMPEDKDTLRLGIPGAYVAKVF